MLQVLTQPRDLLDDQRASGKNTGPLSNAQGEVIINTTSPRNGRYPLFLLRGFFFLDRVRHMHERRDRDAVEISHRLYPLSVS